MLEFCGRKFTCDECPICEGIEHRLRVAREGGYEPQLEYCGCDKVQTEFFISLVYDQCLCTSVEGVRKTTDAESGYSEEVGIIVM